MASFAQKFASKKQEGGGNSIQQEIILESMKQASEDLAAQVSQETSSVANIEAILTRGSKSIAPDKKSEAEAQLEQEIEENSLEKLLGAIELATSPEELAALMQQYEELLASWSEKASILRSEKHLKEYLSIAAALSMLQKMLQNPELLKGKQLSELLQSSLKSQQQSIAGQAKQMLSQNQKLHEQTQMLSKQLSGVEKSLQASIEALKKDPGKLSPQELQATLKQLQESLKQVQELKEKTTSGKPLDFKEMLEGLQKIHAQNQKLIESGKLSETALQAMRQSQQSLQQTLQQTNVVQQLQQNTSALQAAQVQQISQNASQVIQAQTSMLSKDAMLSQMPSPEARGQVPLQQRQPSLMETLPLPTRVMAEASGQRAALEQVVAKQNAVSFITSQALESARIAGTTQAVQSSAQTAVMTGQAIEAARHSTVVQQQAVVVANNTVQQAHVTQQVVTRAQSVPDNVVHLASATQHQAKQEHVAVQQQHTDTTAKQQVTDSPPPATKEAWADMVAKVQSQGSQKSEILETAKKTWTEQCKQQISAKGAAICVCG
jgi:hypothetical protein